MPTDRNPIMADAVAANYLEIAVFAFEIGVRRKGTAILGRHRNISQFLCETL